MNSRKNLFLVASALLASATLGHGEIRMTFATNRIYRQDPLKVDYYSGNFRIRMYDGNWIYGCGAAPFYYPPSIPCPLGSTGYLAAGDGDGDGVRDDFSYWEVITLIPGVAFEPNRPDLCSLYSAPPSTLPRPIGQFVDMTDTMFYNLVDPSKPIRVYKLPDYNLQIPFATRAQMDKEIVTGEYRFSFPRLGSPDVPVIIPVTHYGIPEGYIERNNVRLGFRFTGVNGKALAYDSAGFIGVDPRVANTFTWFGNTADVIFPATDNMYVAISDLDTTPVGNPKRAIHPTNPTVYPGFFAPGATKASRVLLTNALETSVIIPPGFVNPPIVTPNPRESVFRLMLERTVPSSTVAYDTSTRIYELPLRFVNTYEGWAAVAFPPGTSSALRAKTANPDGDAYTNYIEWRNWVVGSALNNAANPLKPDPMKKDVITWNNPILTFVQPRTTRSSDNAGTGYWESKHLKTENAYPPITYQYEYSTDMVNWTVVGDDNPDWLVIDSDTQIKIQSKHATLSGNGYLRVRSVQAPEPPPSSLE